MKTGFGFFFLFTSFIVTLSCGRDPRDVVALSVGGQVSIQPQNNPPAQPVGECRVAVDCDDGSKGTIDSCVDGLCVHVNRPCDAGFELNVLGDCVKKQPTCPVTGDNNPCTLDSCDPMAGEAVHVVKSCNDGDESTDDSCDPTTGECRHLVSCGNCGDDDPCTKDVCDNVSGKCLHEAVECPAGYACQLGTCEKSCTLDADCADENWCTLDSCDEEFGKCSHEARTCDDGDPTTGDACLPAGDNKGECKNFPSACTPGCDDVDKCTTDACVDGKCQHVAAPCGNGTACDSATGSCTLSAECQSDAVCNDGNACTEDECEFGLCKHTAVLCPVGTLCEGKSGECKLLDTCPGGCDDGNACTADVCGDGLCQHVAPKCGPGSALNQTTCQCEVVQVEPDCDNGTVACQQFQVTKSLVYAICVNGAWFTVENCGKIGEGICLAGQGCVK